MIYIIVAAVCAAVLAGPPAGLLGYRQLKRSAAARRLRIATMTGIEEAGFVRIGGIDQWVSIRGEDLRNPVMLEIHGGPGASNLIFIPRTRAWERLGVTKVVLVANSFGTALGLRLARRHPELYSAYVGADQLIVGGGRDRATVNEALLARLSAAGKRKELAAVTAMGPDRSAWTAQQWSQFAKIVVTTDPLTYDTFKTVVFRSLWFSPLHSLRQVRQYMKGMTFSEHVAPETVAIDEWAEGTVFRLPFFIFPGEHDVLNPPEPARRFFDDVTAPVKEFALITGASHFASFRQPGQFLDLMLTKVRPVITGEHATR
jgi:proline iminopeptidase